MKAKKRGWVRKLMWMLGLVLILAGLAAAFVLEGYRLARVRSARTAGQCRTALSRLSGAVAQCAFEGKLEPGARVLVKDLVDRGYLTAEPVCLWGGPYSAVCRVGEKLTCAAAGIPGHDQPVVVHVLGPFQWETSPAGFCRFLAWGRVGFVRPRSWAALPPPQG